MNMYISLVQLHLFQWHQSKPTEYKKWLRTFLLSLSYVKIVYFLVSIPSEQAHSGSTPTAFTLQWAGAFRQIRFPLMVSLAYNSADLHSQWYFPSIQMQATDQLRTPVPHLRITQEKSWDVLLPSQIQLLQTAVPVDSHNHQKGNPHVSDGQADALLTRCVCTGHFMLAVSQALC